MTTLTIDKTSRTGASIFNKPHSSDIEKVIEVPDSGLILRDSSGFLVAAVTVCSKEQTSRLRSLLLAIKFNLSERTSGLKSNSRTFASLPRNALRRDYCAESSLIYDYPEADLEIKRFGVLMSERFRQVDERAYNYQLESLKSKVKSDWIISNTIYTSGIINYNNGLSYHKDNGNFSDLYSGMITLKEDVIGGHLALPEYSVAINLPDSSLLFFQGQNILHGVLPFALKSKSAYRLTAVFYAMKSLCQCGSKKEELSRIQKLKTAKSQKRASTVRVLNSLDLVHKPKYPIFIPSKGRADIASSALAISGPSTVTPAIPFTLVIEPQDEKSYRMNHPLANILILPKSNQGVTYARQFILDYARSNGFQKYWQIDDNIKEWRVKVDGVLHQVSPLYVMAMIEQAVEEDTKIAIAGPDYQQLAGLNNKDYSVNTSVYCCVLTRSDTGINYRPETEMKEDVDFCLQHLSKGFKTTLFHKFTIKKPAVGGSHKGGLTDKYKSGLDALASEKLCKLWPGIATLTKKGNRVDAKINWRLASKETF